MMKIWDWSGGLIVKINLLIQVFFHILQIKRKNRIDFHKVHLLGKWRSDDTKILQLKNWIVRWIHLAPFLQMRQMTHSWVSRITSFAQKVQVEKREILHNILKENRPPSQIKAMARIKKVFKKWWPRLSTWHHAELVLTKIQQYRKINQYEKSDINLIYQINRL